ncbi:MAG: hypothetical protein RR444_06260 [Oscillospiraceae bacterium]
MPFISRIGELKTVVIFASLGCLTYLSGVILGKSGLWLISFSGFFISVIYPTTIISISKVFNINSSYILGIIVLMGSIMNMLFGLLLGNLNDLVGVQTYFLIIPIVLFFFTLLSFIVKRKIESDKSLP